MTVQIRDATIRDLTYVAANMRPCDRHEIECQLAEFSAEWIGQAAYASSPWKWCAWYRGEPVVAFGFSTLNVCVVQAWLWGSARTPRVVPTLLRFQDEALEMLKSGGIRRIEARSVRTHKAAHGMLSRMGAKVECGMRGHGKNGETFLLWARVL